MTLNHPIRSRQDSDQSKYKRIREAGENESLVFGGLFRIYWISTACAPPGAPPAPATQVEMLQASSFLGFNDQKLKKLKAVKKKSKSDSINSKCQKIRKMLEKFNTEEKREIKVNFVCRCCSSGVFIHSSCVKLFIHDIFFPRSA